MSQSFHSTAAFLILDTHLVKLVSGLLSGTKLAHSTIFMVASHSDLFSLTHFVSHLLTTFRKKFGQPYSLFCVTALQRRLYKTLFFKASVVPCKPTTLSPGPLSPTTILKSYLHNFLCFKKSETLDNRNNHHNSFLLSLSLPQMLSPDRILVIPCCCQREDCRHWRRCRCPPHGRTH